MTVTPRPIVLAVLVALARMRHGNIPLKVFSTDRDGLQVKP